SIVDASGVVMAVHQNHSYGHLMGGKNEAHMGKEAQRNKTIGNVEAQGTIADSTWQLKPWHNHDSPRVSVIVIVKNNSAIVKRAVESVLAQNYSDYEIIVVDGAGNQGVAMQRGSAVLGVPPMSDYRCGLGGPPHSLLHQDGNREGSPLTPLNKGGTGSRNLNKGGTGSRNLSKGGIVIKEGYLAGWDGGCDRVAWPTANRKWGALCDRGLEMAQGEFVTFLDSDSVLLPDALEKQVAAFDRESSTLDLLLSGWQLVEGDKITQVTPWQDLPDLEDLHIWKLEKLWQPLRQSNSMFRRSRLDLVGGFNTELNQDAAMVEIVLNLVFLRGSRALWLPEATCSYSGQSNNFEKQSSPIAKDMKEVIDSIFKQPTVKGWMQKLKARAYRFEQGTGNREQGIGNRE
ncbi:MAG: glycosyltransferase, partial [Moorea sp. SIO3C2]|nr:glycosyltransferase [Moorena sp. SIO3C2]